MKNKPKYRLIAYDIKDPKTLQKLNRYLKDIAFSIQYSVFINKSTLGQIEDVIQDISVIINPRTDDVRIYTLPDNPEITVLGSNNFPSGVNIFDITPVKFNHDN